MLIATLTIIVDGGSNFSLVSINMIFVKVLQYLPMKPIVIIRTPKELSKRKDYVNFETVLCCLTEYQLTD